MTVPRLERHFTVEQTEDVCRDALGVVERLEPPEDLRLAVFNTAVGMLGKWFDVDAHEQAVQAARQMRVLGGGGGVG